MGAGFWTPDDLARMMMTRDADGDGKLDRKEVMGLVLPHFDHFDLNKDGYIDTEELKEVARWLNTHHRPGAPAKSGK